MLWFRRCRATPTWKAGDAVDQIRTLACVRVGRRASWGVQGQNIRVLRAETNVWAVNSMSTGGRPRRAVHIPAPAG